jgi:hypothetical protein
VLPLDLRKDIAVLERARRHPHATPWFLNLCEGRLHELRQLLLGVEADDAVDWASEVVLAMPNEYPWAVKWFQQRPNECLATAITSLLYPLVTVDKVVRAYEYCKTWQLLWASCLERFLRKRNLAIDFSKPKHYPQPDTRYLLWCAVDSTSYPGHCVVLDEHGVIYDPARTGTTSADYVLIAAFEVNYGIHIMRRPTPMVVEDILTEELTEKPLLLSNELSAREGNLSVGPNEWDFLGQAIGERPVFADSKFKTKAATKSAL